MQNLASWKPERCIAQIVFKSHVDMTLPNNRQIPLFELAGNFTEWNQQKKDWTMNVNWTRKTQIPVILVNDGSIPAVQDSGLFTGGIPVAGENGVTFTDIPPRSRFPIKATVLAYQYGRSIEPAVQSAGWVERSFMLAPRASSAPR